MANEERDSNMACTGETTEREALENLEKEEGELSSTSVAHMVTDLMQSNADQTEAQSTGLRLPLRKDEHEAAYGGSSSAPQVVVEQARTSPARPTLVPPPAHQLLPPAGAVQQEGTMVIPSIGQGEMMNLISPNQIDASSQIMFTTQGEMGALVCGDNTYNICQQPGGNMQENTNNSYWPINNSYQIPMSNLPPAAAAAAPDFSAMPSQSNFQLTNSQAPTGQFPTSFLQAQFAEWYNQNKINMVEPMPSSFGSQEIQFQSLMNQQGRPSAISYYPAVPNVGGSADYLSSMQFQQSRMNLQSGMPSSSNLHHLPSNWITPSHNYSSISTPSTSRPTPLSRNGVYDPAYESMGLPIDPHLRMFLARRDANGDKM